MAVPVHGVAISEDFYDENDVMLEIMKLEYLSDLLV